MKHQMIRVREHIEVYDQYGEFLFSADTEEEALADLADLLEEGFFPSLVTVA